MCEEGVVCVELEVVGRGWGDMPGWIYWAFDSIGFDLYMTWKPLKCIHAAVRIFHLTVCMCGACCMCICVSVWDLSLFVIEWWDRFL